MDKYYGDMYFTQNQEQGWPLVLLHPVGNGIEGNSSASRMPGMILGHRMRLLT